MAPSRYGDRHAVARRDDAQRRLRSITRGVFGGGAVLTAVLAGLAWASDPGRAATSTSPSPPPASSDSTSSSDPQLGSGGLQAPVQEPEFGGGFPQAVSGGS